MFALTAVQAFFGDSLLVEYGDAGSPKYVLIDGGPAHTYEKHLAGVLQNLKQQGRDLELMVLSHVDTDHVTGLLDLVADVRGGNATALPAIKALWHNSFASTIDPQGALAPRLKAMLATAGAEAMANSAIAINGIAEGHQLRTQALAVPIPLNPGFTDDVVMAETAGEPWKSKNLELTVVGPTEPNLKALRTEWEEWLADNEDAVNNTDEPYIMANSDRSIPNLSSIQLLAKADGKTMLLTGDGRSDHLVQALKQNGLLDGNGRMHVDLLKLPHHGSSRNVTKTFFKKITADTYVASADGKDDNPDLATLIWIVEAAQEGGRKIRIVCTNETESTEKITAEYDPDDFGYTLDIMAQGNHEIRIPLA
jgi:hypothetical protein